jgi:hypothetical protein
VVHATLAGRALGQLCGAGNGARWCIVTVRRSLAAGPSARMAAASTNAPTAANAGACDENALPVALATTSGVAGNSSSNAWNSAP